MDFLFFFSAHLLPVGLNKIDSGKIIEQVRYVLILLFFCLSTAPLLSQDTTVNKRPSPPLKPQRDTLPSLVKDTAKLPEVIIRQISDPLLSMHPIILVPPDKGGRLDSSFLAQFIGSNLSEALTYDGAIALKQYGPGALTSTSFRGASSYQTPILWNGFNIQSPMYGQPDLSLFPIAASDNVRVEYGAGATTIGSGAVSGAVLLENTSHFNEGLNVGLNSYTGSFDTYNNLLYGSYGNHRFFASAKAYYNRAENNFPFNNPARYGNPRMEQPHASLFNYGAVAGLGWRPAPHQVVLINAWYQYSDRNLPPLMTQLKSAASQQDADLKLSAEWQKYYGQYSSFSIRTGLFKDRLNYNDSLSALYTTSHSLSSISEINYSWMKRHSILKAGINTTYNKAIATSESAIPEGYPEGKQQWRSSLFLLYSWIYKDKVYVKASLRKELVDDRLVSPGIVINGRRHYYDAVPEAALNAEYHVFNWLHLRGNVSTLYRVPTLNDLYWNPGGNPQLKPEEGLSEELGLNISHHAGPASFAYDLTYFNRNVNNWIIWLPGLSYWSPENVLQVWSRGYEHRFTAGYSNNKFAVKLTVNYTYTLSTNQKTKSPNDASLDKQLIYCPVHQGALKLYVSYARWYVSYLQSYTGYRYTSTDNLEYLPDYSIAKISAGRTFAFKKISGAIGLSCTNVFDIQYQSVLSQAMPGRSYGMDVKVNFGKKKQAIGQ